MGLLDKLFKKKGKPIAKEEAIKETRKNDKEEATLYKFDGVKAMRIGNFPLAIKFFEKALEVCPEFETRYYYTQALKGSNRQEEALVQYDVLLEEVPTHYAALVERADLLLQQDRMEDSLKDCTLALEQSEADEEKALCYRLLSRIHLALKHYTEAIENAEKALAIQEDDTVSALVKARALTYLPDRSAAIHYISEACQRFPLEERFLLYEAYLYEQYKEEEEATRLYKETLEVDPFNEEAALGLLRMMLNDAQESEALSFIESFIAERNVSSNLKRVYANLLTKNGRESEATSILSELEDEGAEGVADFSGLYQGGIF
ncbi:tetratricopeptide repeat protein [Bacteroidales bacterium KA00251]|nr:tetratricopeptide repeat protein [Bacteroidales bacterium KA00251]